jgi:hypothetical protein
MGLLRIPRRVPLLVGVGTCLLEALQRIRMRVFANGRLSATVSSSVSQTASQTFARSPSAAEPGRGATTRSQMLH